MTNNTTPPFQKYSTQKLQKVLAIQGLGSRRTIEHWIRQGRLAVNGQTASLGLRVQASDPIQLDGTLLNLSKQHTNTAFTTAASVDRQVLLYYKPAGEMCTRQDPQQRSTVFDHLPLSQQPRWVMIGRLDFNTLGLLLLTTDGELAYRLMHPRYDIEREYAVKVHGLVNPAILTRLRRGIPLEGKLASFSDISPLLQSSSQDKQHKSNATSHKTTHWYRVILKEGRYREVRRLWAAQGITVNRLIRIRFGPISLPKNLKPSQWMYLPADAIQQLATSVGL